MNKITICAEGWLACKSTFYSTLDIIKDSQIELHIGANELRGEIDSGVFGISYLISMYNTLSKRETEAIAVKKLLVDESAALISELSDRAAYIDKVNPRFNTRKSVLKQVESALRSSKMDCNAIDVLKDFGVEEPWFDRPVSQTGNLAYQAIAAIAFATGADVFCLPWFSAARYDYFKERIARIAKTLTERNKILIIPHS